jgi:PAS domain S-box-containing protein
MTDTILARRLRAINDVSGALTTVTNLDALLATVVGAVSRLYETPHVYCSLWDAASGTLYAPAPRSDAHQGIAADHAAPRYYPVNPPLALAIARSAAPIVTHDYADACRERGLTPMALPETRRPLGWIGVPMLLDSRVFGVLVTHAPHRRYDTDDVDTLSTIATQAALAIERERLTNETRQRQDEFAAVAEMANVSTLGLTPEAALQRLADRLHAATDCRALGIVLFDEGGVPTLRAQHGLPTGYVERVQAAIDTLPATGLTGWPPLDAVRTGELHVARIEELPPVFALATAEGAGWRTVIGVPLKARGRLIGALSCYLGERTAPEEHRRRFFRLLADQTAVTFENVRLFDEVQERAGAMEAIFRSIPDQVEIFDRDGVRRMVNTAATARGTDPARFLNIDAAERVAIRQLHWPDGTPIAPADLPSMRALAGEIVGPQVIVAQVEGTEMYVSETGAPIYDADGRITGAVTAGRDVTAEMRAERQREALRATIEDISHQLDLRPLLETLTARAAQLIGGFSGTIILVDPETGERRIEAAYNVPGMEIGVTLAPGMGISVQVIAHGGPVILDDYETMTNPVPLVNGARRYASIAVPIWWHAQIIGVLAVVSTEPERSFTQADADLLAMFARHAAIAITNARLYDAVRASEERFRALTESAPDIIYALDADRRLTYVNSRVREILGYTPEEVIGRSAFELVPPESYAPFDMNETPITANTFARGELIAKDGSHVPIEIHTSLLTLGDTVVGVQGIARDIRQAVQLEEEVRERARAMAAIAERQRLARELHDSVTQTLFSMTLIARAAMRQYAATPERAGESLEQLAKMAQGALAEMRSLLFQLRPEAITEAGLVEALKKFVAAVESRDSLPVTLHVEGSERRDGVPVLASEQMDALYRIAQEGLANVVKHARATRAEVRLHFTPEHVALAIVDDGIGYATVEPGATRANLPAGASGGMGLRGIRERLAPLSGTFDITGTPGGGTTLRVTVPVTQPSEVPA